MKKVGVILAILLIIIMPFALAQENLFEKIFNKITGKATQEKEMGPPAPDQLGPSQEEQDCMRACASIGCAPEDMTCMKGNSEKCLLECNIQKPEETEETSCMEDCILIGCSEFDFNCQNQNREKCEEECNMIKEPEPKSKEEACIRECVKKEDPTLICQASEEGEVGNEICKKCAESCVYLYEGPCLGDKEIRKLEKECEKPCKHCYGEPIMGDSGEGWECIVKVECKDASSEWGDEPGQGEGIPLGEKIKNFFKGIFGGDKEELENSNQELEQEEVENTETQIEEPTEEIKEEESSLQQ